METSPNAVDLESLMNMLTTPTELLFSLLVSHLFLLFLSGATFVNHATN